MSEEDINNLKEMLVDFNEYDTDYTKTRCRELEETIENTIKEIERLKKLVITLSKSIQELSCNEEELELLNNILGSDKE